MEPAVFLDRDNTLIANDGDLGDPARVALHPGVPEGLRALRQSGYRLVVVTNQAGVARGKFTEADVDAVHQRIAQLVDEAARSRNLIDRFYYCPYHPEGTVEEYQRDHPWRKPHPGMLVQAAHDMKLDLGRSWLVGDQERDVAAGRSAGCKTVLISTNGGQTKQARPTAVVSSFAQAVDVILRTQTSERGPAKVDAPAPTAGSSPLRPARGPLPTDPKTAPTETNSAPAKPAADPPGLSDLRRAILELADEIRTDRLRRTEFTFLKMSAGLCQLLVVLLAMLGLLQMADQSAFFRWMIGAVLVQLLTIALLVLDTRS